MFDDKKKSADEEEGEDVLLARRSSKRRRALQRAAAKAAMDRARRARLARGGAEAKGGMYIVLFSNSEIPKLK